MIQCRLIYIIHSFQAKRQDNKSKYNSQSEKLKREIALILGKKTAISALLGKQISPKKNKQADNNDDLFKLPALPEKEAETESEFESEYVLCEYSKLVFCVYIVCDQISKPKTISDLRMNKVQVLRPLTYIQLILNQINLKTYL